MYAILSHGGRQYRVSAGDRLVVDRLTAEVGTVVGLEPVLLTGGDGDTALGNDVDGVRVAATVIAHRRGKKLRVFKYRAKKRTRRMAGYRSELTELRVESILAKGAALPEPSASSAPVAEPAAEPSPAKPARRTRSRAAATKAEPATAADPADEPTAKADAPAAKADAPAADAKPAARTRAAKTTRATETAADDSTDTETSDGA